MNRTPLYPLFADLAGRAVLVVGAGPVAARKVTRLLECGAHVAVVGQEPCEELERRARDGVVSLDRRPYSPADLEGKWLVVAATDDAALNKAIARQAADALTFCNVADSLQLCTFQAPSVVRRGQLQLAVSTAGTCPALAKRLRERLERDFTPAYADLVEGLRELREHLRLRYADDPGRRRHLLESFLDSGAPALLLEKDDRKGFLAELRRWKSL